jgi:ATP-dependent RNA helicase DDX52/ROK1
MNATSNTAQQSILAKLSRGARFKKPAPPSAPPSASVSAIAAAVEAATASLEDEDDVQKSVSRGSACCCACPRTHLLVRRRRIILRRLGLKVKGRDAPAALMSFAQLSSLPMADPVALAHLLRNIEGSRFKEPTPVQMQSIPALLSRRDVLAIAPTGSGKTAAFLIPVILAPPAKQSGLRALVVVPTHELADQILNEYKWLSAGLRGRGSCLVLKPDNCTRVAAAARGDVSVDLVVATPQILVGLIEQKAVPSLANVQIVVLDEADRLLEMGFLEQVDTILAACEGGQDQHRAMFSATMPPRIEMMVNAVLRDHVKVTVGNANAGADAIDQRLVFAGNEEGKLTALRRLLSEGELVPPCLVFCQTKERAADLCFEMRAMDAHLKVEAIHGACSPQARDEIVQLFRQGKVWFLVATEVLGRGVDFRGVNTVVNFDLPLSPVSYIHRIGRTGRAGRRGKAITLFTEEEFDRLRPIANVVRISGCDVPEWMLGLKKLGTGERRRLATVAPDRPKIGARFRQKVAEPANRKRAGARGRKAPRIEQGAGEEDEELDSDDD